MGSALVVARPPPSPFAGDNVAFTACGFGDFGGTTAVEEPPAKMTTASVLAALSADPTHLLATDAFATAKAAIKHHQPDLLQVQLVHAHHFTHEDVANLSLIAVAYNRPRCLQHLLAHALVRKLPVNFFALDVVAIHHDHLDCADVLRHVRYMQVLLDRQRAATTSTLPPAAT